MAANSKQVDFDSRYVESLLLDESNIQSQDYAAGRELLRVYSKIPEQELASHVAEIVSSAILYSHMAVDTIPANHLLSLNISNDVLTLSVHILALVFSDSSSALSPNTIFILLYFRVCMLAILFLILAVVSPRTYGG